MAKQRGKFDYNFDGFVEKFERSIYGSFKGRWRLRLLKEDLGQLHDGRVLDVWDAGCGLGHMSCWFAASGHHVTCNDISYKMLQKARESFAEAKVEVAAHKMPAQELAAVLPVQDLVLYHAVIEWTANPLETLEVVAGRVKSGGHLSLLFFNEYALVYRNVMQGSWRLGAILQKRWYGRGKRLTPPHPQSPETISSWLASRNFKIEVQTGIRIFHDYMSVSALEQTDMQELMQLEHQYCRKETYRNMGRYIHILAQKI